jgi:methylenetetrahydrofolate reductase (NADPH)
VTFVLERCQLVSPSTPISNGYEGSVAYGEGPALSNGVGIGAVEGVPRKDRRRLSSVNSDLEIVSWSMWNQLLVRPLTKLSPTRSAFLKKINSRANTRHIWRGRSARREATWTISQRPLGWRKISRVRWNRWVRCFAACQHLQARQLWGTPKSTGDISDIFTRHIEGSIDAIPWSEDGLNEETSTIRTELLSLIKKGWWTVASQPAVNGVKMTTGYSVGAPARLRIPESLRRALPPASDWKALKKKLTGRGEVSYYAGNAAGEFESSSNWQNGEGTVNAVTWGAFPGRRSSLRPSSKRSRSERGWKRPSAFGRNGSAYTRLEARRASCCSDAGKSTGSSTSSIMLTWSRRACGNCWVRIDGFVEV